MRARERESERVSVELCAQQYLYTAVSLQMSPVTCRRLRQPTEAASLSVQP